MRALNLSGVPDLSQAAPSYLRYGLVDIETWRGHKAATGEELQTFVDGVLFPHVYAANDHEGWVELYVGVRSTLDKEANDAMAQLLAFFARGRGEYIGERKARLYGEVRLVPNPQQQHQPLTVPFWRTVFLLAAPPATPPTLEHYLASALIEVREVTRPSGDVALLAMLSALTLEITESGLADRLKVFWLGEQRIWPLPSPMTVRAGDTLTLNWPMPDRALLSIPAGAAIG